MWTLHKAPGTTSYENYFFVAQERCAGQWQGGAVEGGFEIAVSRLSMVLAESQHCKASSLPEEKDKHLKTLRMQASMAAGAKWRHWWC